MARATGGPGCISNEVDRRLRETAKADTVEVQLGDSPEELAAVAALR